MSNKEENEAIIRWLDGELSEEELKQILPKEDILSYKQIINEIDNWVPDNEQEVFDVRLITGATKKEETKVRKLNPVSYLSIAASVVILIVAGVFALNYFDKTSYVADNGKSLELLLPDGSSKVTLASGSQISWTKDDWTDSQRKMTVVGKAFFDVSKGSPFTVFNENGKVEVLGTEFEISGFDDSFIVACYEGKVKATATDKKEMILNAGEENHYFGGVLQKFRIHR